MTYEIQVAFDTDRSRTPQRIIDEITNNNHSLIKISDIRIFNFDLTDFQHAIEILSQVPVDTLPHLKPYIKYAKADLEELSSLTEYFHKFQQEDLKRKSMENIGVGISSLFMNKSFKIDWRDMSHIPKEHFPKNKRIKKADFIGFHENLRYYFEAKGTTLKNNVNRGIAKAKEQLGNLHHAAETKMAFVSYIPCDNLDFPPTLFISDPPSDEEIDLDVNIVRMLHYQNVLGFSGFSTTFQSYSKLVRESIKKRQFEAAGLSENFSLRLMERLKLKVQTDFERESSSMQRLRMNNLEFIGNTAFYRSQEDGYSFFRGVNYDIMKKAIVLDYSFNPLRNENIINEGKVSIFSDGTVLHITRESDKKRKPVSINKPPQETLVRKFSAWSRSSLSNSYRSSSDSNQHEEKEKILVLA